MTDKNKLILNKKECLEVLTVAIDYMQDTSRPDHSCVMLASAVRDHTNNISVSFWNIPLVQMYDSYFSNLCWPEAKRNRESRVKMLRSFKRYLRTIHSKDLIKRQEVIWPTLSMNRQQEEISE